MLKSVFSILILLMISAISVPAQYKSSEPIRPKWLQKTPEPTNSSFRYETWTAIAPTLDEAREKCFAELVSNSGMKNGVVTMSDTKSKETLSQKWVNGKLEEELDYSSHTDIHTKSEETKLYVENIAEYWERDDSGNYVVTRLYAVSGLDTVPLFDNVTLTTGYGARALWKSAIIPGWGQLSKGQKLKGGLILGGCAALAGGIIITENMRADYSRRINETHNADQKRSFARKADLYATSRNVCIGAIGAVYVYGLIDAIVSPGARRVVVNKRTTDSYDYSYDIYPTSPDGKSVALAFCLNF